MEKKFDMEKMKGEIKTVKNGQHAINIINLVHFKEAA